MGISSLDSVRSVPRDYLNESLDYHEDTGEFYWKVRPRDHFINDRAWWIFNKVYSGKYAGAVKGLTYVRVRLGWNGDRCSIKGHHLALAMRGIEIPVGMVVDHINGDPFDNRLSNLRVCTPLQNTHNAAIRRNNTSGYTGVRQVQSGKWKATLTTLGVRVQLGLFANLEEAVAARQKAEDAYFGSFVRDRESLPADRERRSQKPRTKRRRRRVAAVSGAVPVGSGGVREDAPSVCTGLGRSPEEVSEDPRQDHADSPDGNGG